MVKTGILWMTSLFILIVIAKLEKSLCIDVVPHSIISIDNVESVVYEMNIDNISSLGEVGNKGQQKIRCSRSRVSCTYHNDSTVVYNVPIKCYQ